MPEIKKLHSRLNKLVHGTILTSEIGRDLLRSCVTNPVDALLSEISETQLPRKLTFQNNRDESVSMIVSSGRIFEITIPEADYFQDSFSDLETQENSALTEAITSRFTTILLKFTFDINELFVKSEFLTASISMHNIGTAIDDVFECLQERTCDRKRLLPKDLLSELVEECAPISYAALLMNDERITIEYGEKAHLDNLKKLAFSERMSKASAMESGTDLGSDKRCVIYSAHPDFGKAIFCATQMQHVALLLLNHDVLETVYNFWMSQLR